MTANVVVSAVAMALGGFAAASPHRAAEIWGWRRLHNLAPQRRAAFISWYRMFGILLFLAGLLWVVDSNVFQKYHHLKGHLQCTQRQAIRECSLDAKWLPYPRGSFPNGGIFIVLAPQRNSPRRVPAAGRSPAESAPRGFGVPVAVDTSLSRSATSAAGCRTWRQQRERC